MRVTGAQMKILLLFTILTAFQCQAKVFFSESFSDSDWQKRWVQSKHADNYGRFTLATGDFYGDKQANQGLKTIDNSRFYAISATMEPFSNRDSPLVVQYTVKMDKYIDCGGAYIKLFNCSTKQEDFNGDSPYVLMFGPDVCGPAIHTIHTIINYKGKNIAKTEQVKHKVDALTHLYTFIINPDNTYKLLIDNMLKYEGELEADWKFLPPKKIPDITQKKPDDWDDREMIDDPNDTKPEGWDQPEFIQDPESTKPDDWDDEMDGDWEPMTKENPKYRGEWAAKKIPNPNFKGRWEQPLTDNPDYVSDRELYLQKEICGVGFDLWQVQSGTIFDNILITDDPEYAKEEGEKKWKIHSEGEIEMKRKYDEETAKKSPADLKSDEMGNFKEVSSKTYKVVDGKEVEINSLDEKVVVSNTESSTSDKVQDAHEEL